MLARDAGVEWCLWYSLTSFLKSTSQWFQVPVLIGLFRMNLQDTLTDRIAPKDGIQRHTLLSWLRLKLPSQSKEKPLIGILGGKPFATVPELVAQTEA